MYSSDTYSAGRNREMAVLESALEGMLSGQGQVVMVSGEPGIGKTRLAREFAKVAQERNVEVLWRSCPEVQRAPPYWPWIQVIRSVVPSSITSTDWISDDASSEPNRLVPELSAHRSPVRRMGDPDSGRFPLFDSVAAVLSNAAEYRPLMLALDDLHQANVPSLLMLEYVARETSLSRVMILGTYRNVEVTAHHPLRDSLGSLARLESFRRVNLGGLDAQQVQNFLRQSTQKEY